MNEKTNKLNVLSTAVSPLSICKSKEFEKKKKKKKNDVKKNDVPSEPNELSLKLKV